MSKLDEFFNEIDGARVRRVKELSDIKRAFDILIDILTDSQTESIASKAVVVLTYSTWEVFYSECVRTYISFLNERGGKVREKDWMLLMGALHSDLERLRDRHHSFSSRRAFVECLRSKIDCGFDEINSRIIEARSNLNFEKISENYGLLGFDISALQVARNRLDKELVGWRHSVAHGDSPDLKRMDVGAHIGFASSLLLSIADQFQNAMLERL